jgi:tetratricopeptide (TPR) repeat protein
MSQSRTIDQILLSPISGIFLLFILIITIYSNTFNASWHLDDYANIVNNKYIQLTEPSPSALFRSFQPYQNNLELRLSRPISYLSLALNWYIGQKQVIGYHIVNISIHVLASGFLYLFLLSVLKTPRLVGRFQGDENNIALLASVLWAIHPIQTQAITYIVQRMASLSAMFFVLGMFCYIHGRFQTEKRWSRWAFFSGALICMLLAVGSKENTITFPLSIGLIEIILFQNFSSAENRKTCIRIVIAATIVTLTLTLPLLFTMLPDPLASYQSRYGQRSFSLVERLLTESRIVMNYLVQIFYPLLSRFSIEHPITISTSLVAPITTLLSLLSITGFLVFGLLRIHRFPALSLAILFYFLNQVVESTFIPLELVFEHRNYLPSLFLFLPVAIGMVKGLRYLHRENKRVMFFLCSSVLTLLLIVTGMTTFTRNGIWRSEKTLWEDAIEKAPLSARPWASLALYYSRAGYYDKALELYEISLTKQRISAFFPAVTLRNMGITYALKHDYDKALACYDRALAADPHYIQSLYDKALVLITIGDWNNAKITVESLISRRDPVKDAYYLMGIILLKTNEPEEALKYFRMANQHSPDSPKTYTYIGVSLSMLGYYKKADWFLRQAGQLDRNDMISLLYRIDNHIKSENAESLNDEVNHLLQQFRIDDIRETLHWLSQDNMWVPLSNNAIAALISKKLETYSDNLLQLSMN